jgi:hypothetical protein
MWDNSIQKPGFREKPPQKRKYLCGKRVCGIGDYIYKITRKLSKAVYALYNYISNFSCYMVSPVICCCYTSSDFSIILPFTPEKVVFSPYRIFYRICRCHSEVDFQKVDLGSFFFGRVSE